MTYDEDIIINGNLTVNGAASVSDTVSVFSLTIGGGVAGVDETGAAHFQFIDFDPQSDNPEMAGVPAARCYFKGSKFVTARQQSNVTKYSTNDLATGSTTAP